MSPYEQVVHGFQLIEGWHTRYILCLVIASLSFSACVVTMLLRLYKATRRD